MRVPEQLQRAMAAEAEAAREARAKVIAAEGEHKASRALRQAAEVIMDSPAALQVAKFYPYYSNVAISVEISPNFEQYISREQLYNSVPSSYRHHVRVHAQLPLLNTSSSSR